MLYRGINIDLNAVMKQKYDAYETAFAVGTKLTERWGQPVLVENKPGGSTIIGVDFVVKSPPDGYTLLLSNTSMMTINPYTFAKLPYDPEKSYKPVTGFLGASLVLAVNAANVPANNVKEFVAWAKTQSGGVSYASFTAGNSSHFAGVIMNQRTGLNMVHVPFNGTPPAVQNLVGGQVHAAFLPLTAVRPHVESGKVKVLAIVGKRRSPLLDAPTLKEAGFEPPILSWVGMTAPAGTPKDIIAKLHADMAKGLRSPELTQRFNAQGFDIVANTPAEASAFFKQEIDRWTAVVKQSGATVD